MVAAKFIAGQQALSAILQQGIENGSFLLNYLRLGLLSKCFLPSKVESSSVVL
jgi:hypothetical protein